MGSQWKHTADRPLPAESVVKPAPGRAFAVRLQPQRGAELSETRGLAALSGTFTAELWIRGEPSFSGVLFGDWHPHYQGTPVLSYSGWQLEAGVGSSTLDFAFRVAYPLGRGRHGTLRTKGLPRDAKWHHVAFCNTPTDRQIYFDGKPLLDDETVQAAEILDHWAPSPRNLFIGARDFGGGWYQNDVRAVRLSSTRRYVREFVPPAELTKDAETLVLLDFSQHSTSPFVPDLSGAGHHAFMPQVTWMEVEKTWGP
jgi:hypothetical protein